LINAKAVSERFNIPLPTIYELARTNRIGGVVRIGRTIRFDPEKLEQWIANGGQGLSDDLEQAA
jgi:excisionase family DNA binding protein